MSEIDDMMSQILSEDHPKKNSNTTNDIIIDIFRRIIKGLPGAIILFLLSFLCAYILRNYLSVFHNYTTKMEVMIVKEKDGNKQGSISAEVMGGITGWQTTYNKMDETRIMRSRVVVDRLIRNCHYLDSLYAKKEKELRHKLSHKDSTEVYESCIKTYTDAIQISWDEKLGNKTSLIDFSVEGFRGHSKKMLVELVNAYNAYSLEYACQCYDVTLRLLAHSIDSVRNELNKLDDFDEKYSTKNMVIDLSRQSDVYLNYDKDKEVELKNMQLQRQLLRIIRNYMADMGKKYTIVPANTGIDDQQINKIVIAFNELVMKRSDYLTSMGEDAMRVKTITNQIEDQRKAIIVSIDKLTEAFDIRLAKYQANQEESQERLQTMPEKKLVKDYLQRERDIVTPLYERLQQKYTETLIAKASEQYPARIVTPPYVQESLLFSNAKSYYMIAFFLGLILAIIYLWNLQLPERELEVEDILAKCALHIWGILPDVKMLDKFGPAMKSLMTRIEMENAHIILITSGYSHEGKSFFMNQMIEYLIENELEFEFYFWEDIENAKNMAREDPYKSLTEVEDLKQIISRNKGNGKYIIIDAGSYHENPELPILSREADATIYTIRAQHSPLSSLDFCNFAVAEKILFNGAVVVCQAPVNSEHDVSFGNFDYETFSSVGMLKTVVKKAF